VGVAMKILFLGKNRPVVVKSFNWLLENDYDIIGAVIPEEECELTTAVQKSGIPILDIDQIYRSIECKEFNGRNKRVAEVDVVLSVMYWKKIKQPLISHPKKGAINFHPAPLPLYRGLGGYSLAILEEEQTWGVTAHFIDEYYDTGDIIKIYPVSIDILRETSLAMQRKSMDVLFNLFIETVQRAESGALTRVKQGEGRYTSSKDLEALKKISENEDIKITKRKIRAFWSPPWRGAYLEIEGAKYTVFDDAILNEIVDQYTSQNNARAKKIFQYVENVDTISKRFMVAHWQTPFDRVLINIHGELFFIADDNAIKRFRTYYLDW
jgi:methionyl-tRNA formyltransferase